MCMLCTQTFRTVELTQCRHHNSKGLVRLNISQHVTHRAEEPEAPQHQDTGLRVYSPP